MTITIYNEAGEVVTDPQEQARRISAEWGHPVAAYNAAGVITAEWPPKSDKTPARGLFAAFSHKLATIARRRVKWRHP